MTDKRKESHLKIARQIQLLIKACSVPQKMSGYHGDPYPEKARLIGHKLRYELRGKVAIGCSSLDAVAMYRAWSNSTSASSVWTRKVCAMSITLLTGIPSNRT